MRSASRKAADVPTAHQAAKVGSDTPLVPHAWTGASLLESILDSSDDGIITTDLSGMVRSWNKGAQRMFGYTADEAIGQPVAMLAVPERADEIPNILERIRRGEKLDHYETKRQTKDGRVIDVLLTVSPVRDPSGKIVGASEIARDITLDKQAAILQERLAAIVESSDDVIISKDLNGIIRSWNRGAERIFGYTAEEVIGKPIAMLAVPERVEEIPDILDRIRRGERVDHYETKRLTKDGRVLDISLTVSPIRDSSGAIIGASKVARNVTDNKRRAELQERLAAIVESSDDAIISKDLSGMIRSWNKGAERIFGYTAEEAIGRPVTMLAVPERVEEIPDIIERIRRGEKVDHYETKRQTKDGRVLDISLTVSPIRDASGQIIGASKIARDITEQKRLIGDRAQAYLREQEARETAELLNKVGPILAAELDTETLTQKVTDLATRLVGAQFGALFHNVVNEQGQSYLLYTISGVPREHFSKFPMPRNTKIFAPTFAGEAVVRSDDITQDPRYGQNPPYCGMPEGHLPVRSYIAVPVVSRTGEVLGGLFFGHEKVGAFSNRHEDLLIGIAAQAAIALDNARLFSDSKRATDALAKSNEELQRANADLEQFAFSASHDLKEPLRMVAIYSQILQRKYASSLDQSATEYLDKVLTGAKRMDKLVQDLLSYTRSSAPLDSWDSVPAVDAEAVFEQAITNLSQSIQESGARIEKGALPTLRVMEVHLLQLFQNLIENAMKYRTNEPPRIKVEAVAQQDLWRISIHDNGIGIAPEYKDQVFGIFKRLHPSDKYSGTGIGLAICQRLVNRYGGRIWVESEGEGRGSTFSFTLPGGELDT